MGRKKYGQLSKLKIQKHRIVPQPVWMEQPTRNGTAEDLPFMFERNIDNVPGGEVINDLEQIDDLQQQMEHDGNSEDDEALPGCANNEDEEMNEDTSDDVVGFGEISKEAKPKEALPSLVDFRKRRWMICWKPSRKLREKENRQQPPEREHQNRENESV